jgi:hypothetical protein
MGMTSGTYTPLSLERDVVGHFGSYVNTRANLWV